MNVSLFICSSTFISFLLTFAFLLPKCPSYFKLLFIVTLNIYRLMFIVTPTALIFHILCEPIVGQKEKKDKSDIIWNTKEIQSQRQLMATD